MRRLANVEHIGVGVVIDPSATFENVEYLNIGDYSYIGPNVRVIGGSFSIGDYSKIHNNCYIYSKNEISLGHCTWLGQGVHLDGTGGIVAGDFLGVGINSALYSHIRHGDITEGSQFDKDSKLQIGDDVWFVGMCLVSPIEAKDKSMALLGSVVTREMKENSIYAGNPAREITEKVGRPWKETSLDFKVNQVRDFVSYFFSHVRPDLDADAIVVTDADPTLNGGQTVYNLKTRTYTKRHTPEEVELNRWLFGYRAKFKPAR